MQLTRPSLRMQIVLTVALAFAIFVASIIWGALTYLRNETVNALKQDQWILVQSMADELDSKLNLAVRALESEAKNVTPRMLADPDVGQNFLDSRSALKATFDNAVILASEDGRVVAESPFQAGLRGRSIANAEFFKVPTQTQTRFISKPFSSLRAQGRPAITIVIPVKDAQGKMIGRLHGSFELLGDNLFAALSKRKIGEGGYFFVLTRDRVLISHPDPKRIMGPGADPGVNRVVDAALNGFEGADSTVTSAGVPMLTAVKGMKTTGWILGGQIPEAEAILPFQHAAKVVSAMGAVMAIGLTGICFFLVWRFTRPIGLMVEHMKAFPGLSDRHMRSVDDPDLQKIVLGFNEMVDGLTEAERLQAVSAQQTRELNATLEERVHDRTQKLQQANQELSIVVSTLKQTRDDLLNAEKLAALGAIVAGVAHEINTPIGNCLTVSTTMDHQLNALELSLSAGLRRSELNQFIENSRSGTDLLMRNLSRAVELIDSFKQVAVDRSSSKRRKFILRSLVAESVLTMHPAIHASGCKVVTDIPPDIEFDGFPGPLGQVISNLINNAIIHGYGGGPAGCVTLWATTLATELVEMTIHDAGAGIPPEYLERVFEPFFTTRFGQGGSGLGLSISHNIVTGILGGSLEVESVAKNGTTFRILLPLNAPQLG